MLTQSEEQARVCLRQKIDSCASVDEFVAVYDSYLFQCVLGRLRAAMGCIGAEAWAEQWALRMRSGPQDNDVSLNSDRKASLHLLYVLCDRWKDPMNSSVTEMSIRNVFKTRRLVNILQLVLPMDRAQALYSMTYPGATHHGMHWVSQQHVLDSAALRASLKESGGRPTMNKRLGWLFASEVLGLQEISVLRRWMEPKLTTHIAHRADSRRAWEYW